MVKWQGLLLATTLLSLTGCSSTADESLQPAAKVAVGDCLAPGSDQVISCTKGHLAQAVYVSDGPPTGNAETLEPCRRAQANFLGQDFNTRLDVRLWVAQDDSYYRCDVLLRNSTLAKSGYQTLTRSLKGVLRKGAAAHLQACLGAPFDPQADQVYVPCDEPHVAQELIVAPAVGTLDEKFPGNVAARATNACNASADAAGHLKEGHSVSAFYPENAAAWATGERTADCWLSADRGSLPAVRSNLR